MPLGLMPRVVAVRHVRGHALWLRFQDGLEGEVDLRTLVEFTGALAPLKDPAYVALAAIPPSETTIAWPNGADIDDVLLYCAVKGIPVPAYE
jgi:hypothetical protein